MEKELHNRWKQEHEHSAEAYVKRRVDTYIILEIESYLSWE